MKKKNEKIQHDGRAKQSGVGPRFAVGDADARRAGVYDGRDGEGMVGPTDVRGETALQGANGWLAEGAVRCGGGLVRSVRHAPVVQHGAGPRDRAQAAVPVRRSAAGAESGPRRERADQRNVRHAVRPVRCTSGVQTGGRAGHEAAGRQRRRGRRVRHQQRLHIRDHRPGGRRQRRSGTRTRK